MLMCSPTDCKVRRLRGMPKIAKKMRNSRPACVFGAR